jgi:hypothetical protein
MGLQAVKPAISSSQKQSDLEHTQTGTLRINHQEMQQCCDYKDAKHFSTSFCTRARWDFALSMFPERFAGGCPK